MKKVSWEERGRREFNSLKVPPLHLPLWMPDWLCFPPLSAWGVWHQSGGRGNEDVLAAAESDGKKRSWIHGPPAHTWSYLSAERHHGQKGPTNFVCKGKFFFLFFLSLITFGKYVFFLKIAFLQILLFVLHRLGKLLSRRGRRGLLFSTNRHCALLVPPAECRAKNHFCNDGSAQKRRREKVQ